MAGKSRIHKIGSIFERCPLSIKNNLTSLTRVSGLIEKGVIKPYDHPIWFDVYKHHPPKYNPTFDRPALKHIEIKPILYEEDVLRAKIQKLRKNYVYDLSNDYKKSNTVLCQEIMKEGVPFYDAIGRVEKKEIKVSKNKQESTIFDDFAELNDNN